jgi:hypothetical protein
MAHQVADDGGEAAGEEEPVHVPPKDDLGHHVVRTCITPRPNVDRSLCCGFGLFFFYGLRRGL